MRSATKLTSQTFSNLLNQQDLFNQREVLIDLSKYSFISPGALVPLAAICHELHRKDRAIRVRLNEDDVWTYLMRSGFTSVVKDIVQFQPCILDSRVVVFDSLRGSNPLLLEITKIESGRDLPVLLDQIIEVLTVRLKYGKYDAFDIATVISEVCQNTFDHNYETCGFIGMQTYSRFDEEFIEIAVADSGAGLAKTLRENPKNPPINSDFDAIRVATKLGTSQYDDPTRGTGLYHLLEIAHKYEGTIQFYSGTAKVRFRMDKKRGWKFDCANIPGVHITLNLRSKKKT
jgi:anti-sigma regulatory factor (Ser/Thr protein kinase)